MYSSQFHVELIQKQTRYEGGRKASFCKVQEIYMKQFTFSDHNAISSKTTKANKHKHFKNPHYQTEQLISPVEPELRGKNN